jgi:hypothetical protein
MGACLTVAGRAYLRKLLAVGRAPGPGVAAHPTAVSGFSRRAAGAFDRMVLSSGPMNRNSGIGLTSFGIVLLVIGGILRFAVSVHTSGFNIHKVGDILLLVGVLLVILSIFFVVMSGRRRSTTTTDVRDTPAGQQRTQQRDDWGTP